LLSIFTLVVLPLGVWNARHHLVAAHRRIMICIFCGALVIAGLFTLLPGGSCTASFSAISELRECHPARLCLAPDSQRLPNGFQARFRSPRQGPRGAS
jgi:hypothetical protein